MSKVYNEYTPLYTSSPPEKRAPLTPAEKMRAMRERKKEEAAKAVAPTKGAESYRERKNADMRALRERKKEAGLTRLDIEPEYPYLWALQRACELCGQTMSEGVSALIRAFLNCEDYEDIMAQQELAGGSICEWVVDLPDGQTDDDAPSLAYVTYEYNPGSLSLDLNAADHAFLTGQKGMSATTTLEVLINGRMFLPCPERAGTALSDGYVLSKADVIPAATGQRMPLVYVHPANTKRGQECPTFILSRVQTVSRSNAKDYALCSQKYVRRTEAILRATGRLPVARSASQPVGPMSADAMLDVQLARINRAASSPSEAFKAKVRHNIDLILERREEGDRRSPEAWGDRPPAYEREEEAA